MAEVLCILVVDLVIAVVVGEIVQFVARDFVFRICISIFKSFMVQPMILYYQYIISIWPEISLLAVFQGYVVFSLICHLNHFLKTIIFGLKLHLRLVGARYAILQ